MSGIFTLGKVGIRQGKGTWSTASDVWLIGSPVLVKEGSFGYFGGGDTGSGPKLSTVERIDYNNDTPVAAVRGPLAAGRYHAAGNSSTTHAYFGGGENPSIPGSVSTIQRIDYSNDTATSTPKGLLSQKRSKFSGTGTIDFGYFGGGVIPGFSSTVDRIDYANDTATAVAKGPLTSTCFYPTATGNQSHGYFHLGTTGANQSTIDRLDYSSDSTACVTKGPLSVARFAAMSTTNGNLYGYWAGGTSNPPDRSTVDRLDYSSDTSTCSPKGSLSATQARTAAVSNSKYAWMGGGSSPTISTVNRIDYSNDTATASVRGSLATAKYGVAAASASSNAISEGLQGVASNTGVNRVPVGHDFGYGAGGNVFNPYVTSSTVDRIDFSNDTPTASVKGPLSAGRYKHTAVSSLTHGYVLGGSPAPNGVGTTNDRIDYANDTATALLRGTLVERNIDVAAAGTTDFGYMAGGLPKSTVQRIEYASDNALAVIRGPLSAARRYLGGVGNQNYGYFAGGAPGPGYMSTIDRIDYSNDTATAVAKGPLPAVSQSHGGTGGADFGYWTGGFNAIPGSNNWISTVNRLDYSNDTTSPASKGPLSVGRSTQSTGTTSYGWSLAGNSSNSTPGMLTTVDRIDFSNDTATASVRGPLTRPVAKTIGAMSSRDSNLPTQRLYSTIISNIGNEESGTKNATEGRGYVLGGFYPTSGPSTAVSTVQRIDFANDTATGVAKGPLSANRSNTSGNAGNQDYGYTAGGYGPVSIIDRTDYSNDTAAAVAKGPLDNQRYAFGGMSNMNYGWFAGGSPGSTRVDRVDFSNDAADALVRGYIAGNVGNSPYFTSAAGNQYYGYVALGVTTSEVDRLDYSNDTTNLTPKGPLVQVKYAKTAVSNSNYGYWGGGQSGPISTIDRLDFSNDTATGIARSQLSVARRYAAGASSPDFGYFMGGAPGGWGAAQDSTVDRLDYSNDTAAASPKGPLAAVQGYCAGNGTQSNALPTQRFTISTPFAFGENPTSPSPYGYFGGGYTGSSIVSTVDRLDYGSDTTATAPKGTLSVANYALSATGNQTHGYFGGGYNGPSVVSKVDRIDYSNDSIFTSVRGNLTAARSYLAATSNTSHGYFGGGYSGPFTTIVDRIDYSNDTATASPRGPLSVARYAIGATGNTSYGYFAGGQPGPSVSTVDRIDYSSDTGTTPTKGPLSVARKRLTATGNASYGYFGGGFAPSITSSIDRLDFSNDTATASPKGLLSLARYGIGATGNTSHGYFGGGQPGPSRSTVDRIDYGNDTATATEKGPLTSARYSSAAVSSRANALPQGFPQGTVGTYGAGYWGAGGNPSQSEWSTVGRLDFANDTAKTLTRGPLNMTAMEIAATSSTSHGYFAGGEPSSPSPGTTYVDRIDYSNDTPTASPRGPLTVQRKIFGAVSNVNFGYFGSGQSGTSKIDRIDFGNDTVTAPSVANFPAPGRLTAATGNKNYGYFIGGADPNRSSVSRIDYSNDTPTAALKGPLSAAIGYGSASGNEDFAYHIGGWTPGPGGMTTVERITYANDTATGIVKGPLSATVLKNRATGNQSFGYSGGGMPAGNRSSIERIDYSNDTALGSVRSSLHAALSYMGASSARSHALPIVGSTVAGFTNIVTRQNYPSSQRGYFAAGMNPVQSKVERITYANDTATAILKGPLSYSNKFGAAAGNQNYAYYTGGGYPAVSNVDRIDYANDDATATPKGNLSATRYRHSGAGNEDFGWFAGGYNKKSSMDRIDYSNDTATASPRGNLSDGRDYLSGSGNVNYGWWGGGTEGGSPSDPGTSIVDRIDYGNDTATASPKGPLSSARTYISSTGNKDYGYWGGGQSQAHPGTEYSTVDRVDYSNDTATATVKGPLATTRSVGAATGNKDFGYFAGDYPAGPAASWQQGIDRIDFSNDTATALVKGALISKKYILESFSGGENGLPQFGG